MKKPSISSLKKKCWTACSIYIRKRYADFGGYVKCVTCGTVKHWTEGDAGHFLSGRMNAILFDIRGLFFQCKPCNGGLKNQTFTKDEVAQNYLTFMLENYGQEVVDDLKRLQKTTRSFKPQELIDMTENFKKLASELSTV